MAASCENESVDSGISDCPICLKSVKDPQFLPCSHTFCESCVNIRSSLSELNQTVFKCPLCNCVIESPSSETSTKNLTSNLTSHQLVYSPMELTHDGKNNLDICCSPCKRGGEIAKAKHWCHDCSDALCESCHVFHRRMRVAVSHKIVPIENVSTAKVQIESFEKQCLDHSDNGAVLNSYCLDHNEPCCEICLTTKHSGCQNVCQLQDLSMKVKNENFVQDVLKQITDVNAEVHLALTEKQRIIERLETRHREILSGIETLIEKAKDHMDKLHLDLKQDLEAIHEQRMGYLTDKLKKIETFQSSVTYDQKIISSLLEIKPCLPTYATIERIKTQLLSNMTRLKSDFGEDETFEYELEIDDTFKQITTGMKHVGKVIVHSYTKPDTLISIGKAVKCFGLVTPDSTLEVQTLGAGKNGFRHSYIEAIETSRKDICAAEEKKPLINYLGENRKIPNGIEENRMLPTGGIRERRNMEEKEQRKIANGFQESTHAAYAHEKESVFDISEENESISKAPRKTKFCVANSWVQSSCFLEKDIIIIPDYYYEKLLFYDTQGDFIFEQYMYKKPWHVTTNLKGQIFVSYPDSHCIRKYNVKRGILFSARTVQTGMRVEYFEVLGHMFVFLNLDKHLMVINKKGKILDSLPVKCSHFAASKTEDKIYYSVDKVVKCHSFKGDDFFNYECPSVLQKLYVDKPGKVYIVFGKYNLHVVSYNGVLLRNIEINATKTAEFINFDYGGELCLMGWVKGSRYDPRRFNPERFWEGDASFTEYSEVSVKLQIELFKISGIDIETKV